MKIGDNVTIQASNHYFAIFGDILKHWFILMIYIGTRKSLAFLRKHDAFVFFQVFFMKNFQVFQFA